MLFSKVDCPALWRLHFYFIFFIFLKYGTDKMQITSIKLPWLKGHVQVVFGPQLSLCDPELR